ncbi:MBL fold metallo-hydrolase [Patescibacteria group bacterium]|nr:MBL fold metallo-hydrolase [Patescibacteria group bacterium]
MDLRFYDVEHGDSCLVLSQKNEAVLIDCGYNSTTGFKPSEALSKQGFGSRRKLHHLILTHPDQDHLADLPNVIEKLKPINVWQHPQLTLKTIADLKVTLSKAQEAYLAGKKTTQELQPIEVSRSFQTMKLRQFYLPIGSVRDANDLSLVTFLTEERFTVCFSGDLTSRGWKLLLENKAFQYMLRETNLFVASHHGRPTGYYEPVYEYLYPKLIVISDKEQSKGRTVIKRVPYREHAYGVKLNDGSFRKVLTTREDGRIRVVVKDRVWEVSTSRSDALKKKSEASNG